MGAQRVSDPYGEYKNMSQDSSVWGTRITALILAIITWLMATQSKIDVIVPVSLEMTNLPVDLIIVGDLPSEVSAIVRGPKGNFRVGNEAFRLYYPLPLNKLGEGKNVQTIDPKAFDLPRFVEVLEVRPSRLEILAERKETKEDVKVTVQYQGNIPENFIQESVEISPSQVTLTGPSSVIKDLSIIPTQKINLGTDIPNTMSISRVGLDLPNQVEANPKTVSVWMTFSKKVTLLLPVEVVGDTDKEVSLNPSNVAVTLLIPSAEAQNQHITNNIRVVLDLNPKWGAGRHSQKYNLVFPAKEFIEKGVSILQSQPEKITVILK